MKVLLIYPPAFNMITTNVPSAVDEESGFYPPLGLLYIAAYMEENSHHKVEILDTQVLKLSYDDIEEEIRKRQPDVVGIQTMTFTVIDAIETARRVKKVSDKIKIVLGGPHVFIYPEESISIPEVDYLVLGEGEITFTKFINCLEEGGNLEEIKGLVFKKDGKIIHTGINPLIDDLDSLPIPARHLLPIEKYYSVLARYTPVTTMMTSRGCPYQCIFCDRPHLGKSFRCRSAMKVVDEMQICKEMGIREFFLYDDTFSIKRDRVVQVCDEIIKRKLDIHWDIRARINTMDKELLQMLKKAGCARIHYGIESGTPEIIKVLKKGIDLERAKEVFKETKKAGITTLGYFMLGNPTETREQMLKTIEYAKELDADFIHCALTTPFPGTELYTMGLEKGILPYDYWKEFAKNPTKDFVPYLWEENLKREELIELLSLAYKSFYQRPTYILKRVLEVRSWDEFKRKAKAGLKLFKI